MGNSDIYNLSRFIEAQDSCEAFETAIEELKVGRKRSHWVWFVFPQLKGLGHSYNSKYYGIGSIDEAKAYLDDGVLRKRLVAVCMELMSQVEDHGLTARRVLGGIDAMKVKSCRLFLMQYHLMIYLASVWMLAIAVREILEH